MTGAFMVAGGVLALASRSEAVPVEGITGGTMLLAGLSHLFMGATDRDNPRSLRAWQSSLGALLLGLGGMLVVEPLDDAVTLSILLGAIAIAVGVVRVVLSLTRRQGWLGLALSGGLTVILGFGVLLSLAWTDGIGPGRILAVDLISAGVALILAGPGRRVV